MDLIDIREQARRYLHDHPASADKLSKRLDVPYWWLVKFRSGEIKNPSVERLQRIVDFMAAERGEAA